MTFLPKKPQTPSENVRVSGIHFSASITNSTKQIVLTGIDFSLVSNMIIRAGYLTSGVPQDLPLSNITISQVGTTVILTFGDKAENFNTTNDSVPNIWLTYKAIGVDVSNNGVRVLHLNSETGQYKPERQVAESGLSTGSIDYLIDKRGYRHVYMAITKFADSGGDGTADIDVYTSGKTGTAIESLVSGDWVPSSDEFIGGTQTITDATGGPTEWSTDLSFVASPYLKLTVDSTFTGATGSYEVIVFLSN